MVAAESKSQPLRSLTQVLQRHVAERPEQLAYQFLENGTDLADSLRYRQLDERARAVAVRLGSALAPGDRAILLYPAGLDFLEGFLGALYAGVIPIPAPTPDAVQFKRAWPRLQAIIQDAAVSLILTNARFEPTLREALPATTLASASGSALESTPESAPGSALVETRILVTDRVEDGLASQFQAPPTVTADDLAYLQYTSGSTAAPKGVMISHGTLMAQLQDLQTALDYSATSRSLNWMPHHHDYGLVQGLLLPLFAGARGYVMSPTSFIRKPMRWLEAISTFEITHSQGSNFAYAYCLRKFDAEQASSLNLSRWSVASIGAEPINPEVLQRFERTFKPFGFKAKALTPAFGLAEATLVVTTRRPGEGVRYGQFEARALANGRVAESANQAQRSLVGCGPVIGRETQLCIVDPESHRACPNYEIGEIWVAGPSVASGYWNRPEESEGIFGARLADSDEGPFLRTGDLGFINDGELFIVGRHKDLIIIRGQNHYPQDIEFAVEASHPKLRAGRSAAFSVEAAVSEQLVVVVEFTGSGDEALYQAVVGAINEAVGQAAELSPHAIVLIRSGSLPVTSSGKIQRQACRQRYIEQTLEVVYAHIHDGADESLEPEGPVDESASRQPLIEQLLTADSVDDQPLRAYLLSLLAEVLKSGSLDWLAVDHDLLELGIDSLASVELRSYLEEELELSLPINYIILYPTLAELSGYLKAQLVAAHEAAGEKAAPSASPSTRSAGLTDQREGRALYGAKEKRRLIDWEVHESDAPFELTDQEIRGWDKVSVPPDKGRMEQRGTRLITDDWKPQAPFIHWDSNVLGLGSCFTRDIVLWLAECGFNRRFPGSPYDALLRYPAIGNNAYLAEQFRILDAVSGAAGEGVSPGEWAPANREGASRFLDAERDEGRQLYQLLREMDVLILTLGSIEAWWDSERNNVLKIPMLLSEYDPQRHRFRAESYADTRGHLEQIDRIAQHHFPNLKIIFTLPLGRMATFRPLSALSAATIQEATLRTALAEFLEARSGDDRLHYFPAYELFTQFFQDPYQADNLHATPYVTGRLCASFAEMFCADAPQTPASESVADHSAFHQSVIGFSLEAERARGQDQELKAKIEALEAQNRSLKQTCDERLAVIEELDQAARERLALIEQLDAQLRAQVR